MSEPQSFELNCDLGEGQANDHLLMPYLDACSIACGGHAGDQETMKRAIEVALTHEVCIGAHPSFPDKEGFGRKIISIEGEVLKSSLYKQVSTLDSLCKEMGVKLTHIKAHGALYNLAARDETTSKLILEALSDFNLPFFAPWGSDFYETAIEANRKVKAEAFADRRYNNDLSLVDRKMPNAVISDPQKCAMQVLSIARENLVDTITGNLTKMKADTFCVHGDNPSAEMILKTLRSVRFEE